MFFIGYSIYFWKKKRYFVSNNSYILDKLPAIQYGKYNSSELLAEKGNFIHFWATCANCEKELPEFVNSIESFDGGVQGSLIATKDIDLVNKKLKKLKLNKNYFKIIHDPSEIMRQFGSLRVPETFLFLTQVI